jgi:hypothetical protein
MLYRSSVCGLRAPILKDGRLKTEDWFMRLAWFRPTAPDTADPLDDTARAIAGLVARHTCDLFDARRAADFVWMHARRPYDLPVYELDDTPDHQFIWGYLMHYPGVTFLRSRSLLSARAAALERDRRHDLDREIAFDTAVWPLLRAPTLASRSVVVAHAPLAAALAEDHPDACIRHLPPAVAAIAVADGPRPFTVGAIAPTVPQRQVIERAAQQVRDAGIQLTVVIDANAHLVLEASDAIVALHWPPGRATLADGWAALAAGRPVILFETLATSDWPAIDPQTGQPRSRPGLDAPVCVTVDPRDEQHSLALALRRLASDADMRTRLGQAGRLFWRMNAHPDLVVERLDALLQEAIRREIPPKPPDWPSHLSSDATELARDLLAPFGIDLDILRPRRAV